MTTEVLDFYADWCGPCKQMEPILDEFDEENPDVNILKVDVDTDEGQRLANRFNARSLPTVVVARWDDDHDEGDLDRYLNGGPDEIVDRFVGITDKADLESAV